MAGDFNGVVKGPCCWFGYRYHTSSSHTYIYIAALLHRYLINSVLHFPSPLYVRASLRWIAVSRRLHMVRAVLIEERIVLRSTSRRPCFHLLAIASHGHREIVSSLHFYVFCGEVFAHDFPGAYRLTRPVRA
jgi:hypothetical protein